MQHRRCAPIGPPAFEPRQPPADLAVHSEEVSVPAKPGATALRESSVHLHASASFCNSL